MKALIITVLAISSSISTASAEPNGCYNAQDIEILLSQSTTSLTDMRRCLNDFRLPDNRNVNQLERTVDAVAKACAKFIPREKEEDLDSFCYGIYNQNPEAMNGAWLRLNTRERAIVQKSYREIRKANLIFEKQAKP